jgi:hypothetical protein
MSAHLFCLHHGWTRASTNHIVASELGGAVAMRHSSTHTVVTHLTSQASSSSAPARAVADPLLSLSSHKARAIRLHPLVHSRSCLAFDGVVGGLGILYARDLFCNSGARRATPAACSSSQGDGMHYNSHSSQGDGMHYNSHSPARLLP